MRNQFRTRAAALKVRGVLDGLDRLVRDKPREGAAAVVAGIERIYATAHTLRELSLLARARASGLPLRGGRRRARRAHHRRQGHADHRRGSTSTRALTTNVLRQRVDEQLVHWRTLAQSPLTERATVEVCRVVIRSLEEMASELGTAVGSDGTSADVDAPGRPGDGAGEGADQQTQQHQGDLDGEQLPEELAVTPGGDKL